jgi:uncharacterized membrane protein
MGRKPRDCLELSTQLPAPISFSKRPTTSSAMTATLIELETAPDLPSGIRYMDASIRPNKALSERGLTVVMLALMSISFVAGVSFLLIGAWPVVGFFGLDIILVWWALRHTARRLDKQHETVTILSEMIHVSRTDARGAVRHWTVSPAFARVSVEEKEDFPPEVSLICGGQGLSLGAALAPSERRDLARAMEQAIWKARGERHASQQDNQD